MILSALIMGATLVVGGSLIVAYWNNIIDWLKRAITKVQSLVNHVV